MSKEFTQDDLRLLARQTKSYLAQAELYQLTGSDLIGNLARNQNLDPVIWDKIYSDGEYEELKGHLLSNATRSDQAARFITEPNRRTQYLALELGMSALNPAILANFIRSNRFDAPHASALLSSGKATSEQLPYAWKKVRNSNSLISSALEAAVGNYNFLSEKEIVEVLERAVNLPFSQADPSSSISRVAVTRLIDFKPGMIPLLMKLEEPDRYYMSISTSRHLTQEVADTIYLFFYNHPEFGHQSSESLPRDPVKALVNLVLNPATSPKKRLEVYDYLLARHNKSQIKGARSTHLVEAATEFVNSRKRKLEELGTSWGGYVDHNLETYGPILSEVADAVTYMEPHNYPSLKGKLARLGYTDYEYDDYQEFPELTVYEISDKIDPYLDQHGLAAWRLFTHLLPEWQSDLDELLIASTGATTR